MNDPYLYPGTEVLKNLADIHDEVTLSHMEAEYTSSRLADLAIDNFASCFTFNGLCDLHYTIFQDIYEWAGKPRIINIEKSENALGGISIEYSDCFDITRDATAIIKNMNSTPWEKIKVDEVCREFSLFMAKLWKVHPFREGNTRTVITFCTRFLEDRGIYIDNGLFKDNAAYMRTSLVAASAIFSDLGDRRKTEYLERIVLDALQRGENMKKRVISEFEKGKLPSNESMIKEIIRWNRIEHREHTTEELTKFFAERENAIKSDILSAGFLPSKSLISNVSLLNDLTGRKVSLKDISTLYKYKDWMEKREVKTCINAIAEECKEQELTRIIMADK